MSKTKPTYRQLEKRLAAAEPIIDALRLHEVDAVVGEEKIAFLLLRKVEEACLESNGEFSAMFNLDGIGMIQADAPAFRFTRVNPKFCEVTGYSAEDLLTMTYIGLTHPQDRERGLKEIARVIRGKSDSWSIEKRCVRKDGRVIWVNVHGAALRDHAGRAVRIMAMVEDITARKEAGDKSSAVRGKLIPRKKASIRKTRKSAGRSSSNKPSRRAGGPVIEDSFSVVSAPSPRKILMKTQGEIEAAVCKEITRFAEEYMGRGPKNIRAFLIGDLLVVRLQGVLTAAEQHLVKTLPTEKGRELLKQVRTQLIETARPVLDSIVQEITGSKVLSLHHDISTLTGEEVVIFTLATTMLVREKKPR